MPKVSRTDTERFELPDEGEWVELRRRIGKAERDLIEASFLDLQLMLSGNSRMEDIQFPIDVARAKQGPPRLMAEIGIVAWGWPEPVTPDEIGMLEPETFDLIVQHLDGLWRPRSEEEKKASPSNGRSRSSGASPSRKASGGTR